MNRKTKADLEAEIRSLKQENVSLRDENIRLTKGIDVLTSQITNLMVDGSRQTEKFLRGSQANKRKAAEKQLLLDMRFNSYCSGGMDRQRARNKANEDVIKIFGKGYEKSRLIELLPRTPPSTRTTPPVRRSRVTPPVRLWRRDPKRNQFK